MPKMSKCVSLYGFWGVLRSLWVEKVEVHKINLAKTKTIWKNYLKCPHHICKVLSLELHFSLHHYITVLWKLCGWKVIESNSTNIKLPIPKLGMIKPHQKCILTMVLQPIYQLSSLCSIW